MAITHKGTGTPKISQLFHNSMVGCGSWRCYEKYSLNLNIVDASNQPIENVNIKISLDGTLIYSGVTDSSGDSVSQNLTNREWFFDPINFNQNRYKTGELTHNDYDVTISKSGYETTSLKLTMNTKRTMQIKLRNSISPGRDDMGNEFK